MKELMNCLDKLLEPFKVILMAQKLASQGYLREAIAIVEKVTYIVPGKQNLWQQFKSIILAIIFYRTVPHWRLKVARADRLREDAKAILAEDTGDPLIINNLTTAIDLYQQCGRILIDDYVSHALENAERELQKRQEFATLLKQGKTQGENWEFKTALITYRQAEKLYPIEAIKEAIAHTLIQVQKEKIYEASLAKAIKAQAQGKLVTALNLLEAAYSNFPRPDGSILMATLRKTIAGKKQFRQGLTAEKQQDFSAAIGFYQNAGELLPNSINCRIRLAAIAIKTHNPTKALSHLQGIPGEQASYLRGFAHFQNDDLQTAYREWENLSGELMIGQRHRLKTISERKRVLSMQNIQTQVNSDNLQQAIIASQEFINTFGFDPLVESNLNEHIKPRLMGEMWHSNNWENIATQMETQWLSKPNNTTLHNWVVASYYHAQKQPEQLNNLIIVLTTALANLDYDPTLQDIPWLGKPADFTLVATKLQSRLQAAIDDQKDYSIDNYLSLNDSLRRELIALELMGQPVTSGMRINDIWITPGCHERYLCQYQSQFTINLVKKIDSSQKILHALYTKWGLAVAACLSGDTSRAIYLKPLDTSSNSIEIFAEKLVGYHQGCYELQQQNWRNAVVPFQTAQSEIDITEKWQEEIDRLCGLQRQNIDEFAEHLEFARFWYNTVKSKPSRAYLAEYEANKIRSQIANEQISFSSSLSALRELTKIDPKNPIVLELIATVEFNQELEVIQKLLRSGEIESAVTKAKQSQNHRLRKVMADICIEILLQAVNKRELSLNDIRRLGHWAYELCPHEPVFQEIYRSLQLY